MVVIENSSVLVYASHRDIYSGHSPPPWAGKNFCPNWKKGKNLKEDFKKGKEKGGKEENKEKSDKTR